MSLGARRGTGPGQTALVVGAAGGIGRAVSLRLASDGIALAISDSNEDGLRSTLEAISANGGRAVMLPTDIADVRSAVALVDRTEEQLGRLSILVYSAGVIEPENASVLALDAWESTFAINVRGAYLVSLRAYPIMRTHGYGRIVFVASMAARTVSVLGGPAYTASKSALLGLARHLAREWTSDGITVNTVSPGLVDTAMGKVGGPQTFERTAASLPLRRAAHPEEIAAAVCFLTSSSASYVSGANLEVHGGASAIS